MTTVAKTLVAVHRMALTVSDDVQVEYVGAAGDERRDVMAERLAKHVELARWI